MIDKLVEVISKTVILSDEDIERCESYFELVSIPRNTILEEQGKKPT